MRMTRERSASGVLRRVKVSESGSEELDSITLITYIPESGSEELPSQGVQVCYLYKRSVVRAHSKCGPQVQIVKCNDSG